VAISAPVNQPQTIQMPPASRASDAILAIVLRGTVVQNKKAAYCSAVRGL
jgi:hypothetical protein